MKNILKIATIFALFLIASCGKEKSTTADNIPAVLVTVSTPQLE